MDYREIQDLMEAYNAVYDEEVREEYLKEDYSFIDGLDDEELTDVVEEVIYGLLDEGYEVEELEELFEETFLTEGRVDMEARAKARREYARSSEQSARQARKAGAAVVKKEKREERKEKIKSAARGVLSNIKKGITRAAKKVGIGVEKARQSMSGVDRGAERAQRRVKAKMTQTARAGIRKAVTGKAADKVLDPQASDVVKRPKASQKTSKVLEPKASDVVRRDVTGSTAGAGAAGTIRSKSAAGSGDGPSSQGRALPPKGATSRTPAGNLRRASQITYTLSKAQSAGKKKLANLNNSFDLFDIVTDFLMSEGLAEDVREATWIMANELSEEHIDQIVDLYDLEELYKGKHGESETQYQDSRSDAGKRISGDSKTGPRYYTLGRSRGAKPDAPTKPGARPVNTPKVTRSEKEYARTVYNSSKGKSWNKVGGEKGLPG